MGRIHVGQWIYFFILQYLKKKELILSMKNYNTKAFDILVIEDNPGDARLIKEVFN